MYHLHYRRILLQILLTFFAVTGLMAQNAGPDRGLEVNVSMSPEFDAVNIENLITLTFTSVNDVPAVTYEITHTGLSGPTRFLMETLLRSESEGLILRSTQNPATLFEMEPGEVLRFNNLDIIRGTIPGQSENIKFDFVLTNRGRQLLSKLNKGAVADEDRFYVDVRILPENNEFSEPIAAAGADIETNVPYEFLDIEPHQPTLDSLSTLEPESNIPVLRWQAPENQSYRLIVARVEPVSGSGERILENRFEQEFNPLSVTEPQEGILLDVVVNDTEFTVPEAITPLFVPGGEYVWQVGTEITTLKKNLSIRSDIWRFSIPEIDLLNREIISILSEILGEDKVEEMIEQGYELEQIELGGEVYSAEEAVVILREMLQKIRNRRATIGG